MAPAEELADPECSTTKSSPVLGQLRQARADFEARFGKPSSSGFSTPKALASVTGVGFFDFVHGQSGVAPNGIELQ